MITNIVLDAGSIIQPEDMDGDMRMVLLKSGEVVFVNSREEYQRFLADGLIKDNV